MDHWAPVVRHWSTGVGQMTNDSNTIAVSLGIFAPGTNAVDCAAHATVGDKWSNVYGELLIRALTGASSKAGFWLRMADTSNYYAAYMTPTTAAVDSVVAGSTTSLLSTSVTLGAISANAGASFRAEINGDAISVYWRGTLIGSVRDTSLTAAGFASLYLRSTTAASNVQAERFEVGPLTASYTPAIEVQQAGPSVRARKLR